jgi:hypothetical protein
MLLSIECNIEMLKTNADRASFKERISTEEYKNQMKESWAKICKESTDDHLLDLAGYSYSSAEERKEARANYKSREEFEKKVLPSIVMLLL